jgi:hypothetical protein
MPERVVGRFMRGRPPTPVATSGPGDVRLVPRSAMAVKVTADRGRSALLCSPISWMLRAHPCPAVTPAFRGSPDGPAGISALRGVLNRRLEEGEPYNGRPSSFLKAGAIANSYCSSRAPRVNGLSWTPCWTNPSLHMSHLTLLSFDETHRASTSPGLYAWYGSLYASVADYKREADSDGNDIGAIRFRRLLARHMLRYQPSPLELRARNTFGADWRGALEDRSKDPVQDVILGRASGSTEQSTDTKGLNNTVNRVSNDVKLRRLLVRILQAATPSLASPIYVGVATNLQERLGQHVSLYKNLKDAIGTDENKLRMLRDKVREEGLEFAHRAVAMDFGPEQLQVITLDVKFLVDGTATDNELREVAGVAEWLLNRWHRPFAGRR